ncbi:MAG: glutathionylspermidine synthase family protein [Burkholderiales bacterium]|nr:glutathionylspermidine synthase family protein [Burkholderiales bacterium]
MQRETLAPRSGWPEKVEALGLSYHTIAGDTYWDESACYRFSAAEVDRLEEATAELHARALEAVERVVERKDFARFSIPEAFHGLVAQSWRDRDPSLYGRMDFSWNGEGEPKLLEYNADTPTALLEASVIQWYWMQDVKPGADQFNSIHEKLIERWKAMRGALAADGRVYFAGDLESPEDAGNLDYLRDTALQAGLEPIAIAIEDIGWDGSRFLDLEGQGLGTLFKLYPWEWLVREAFGPHLLRGMLRVIEPPWKMLLSNKAILPVMWEMFPGHPNLLAASFEPGRFQTDFVKKPLYSREGANVSITSSEGTLDVPGDYGEEGFIWQAYHELASFGGRYAVIGSWVVGGDAAGIGIREDASPVTRDTSRFVPHYFT